MNNETILFDLGDGPDTADAMVFPGQESSRADLMSRATKLSQHLGGARSVAMCAAPTLETVIGVIAGLLAGVTVVPVAPDSGIAERTHVISDSGAELFVGPHQWSELKLPVVPVPSATGDDVSQSIVSVGESALLLYTSGTTGLPKGVPISGMAIAVNLDALAKAWDWSADDTLVHGLPLFHLHGLVLGLLGALRHGSRLVHTGRPTPERYAKARGSLYFGVPTVWSRVCEDRASAEDLRSARLLVSGSAPLPLPVFARLSDLTGRAPVERYGMTETLITLSTRANGERRPGSVGRPLEDVQTRLIDDDGEPLASNDGVVGDLEVRGPTVTPGYFATSGGVTRPKADFLADGWFHTGDVATIDRDGFHRIVGRRSTDLIKSGGYRIGAGEVEAALLAHPAVRSAAVIGVPDIDLGQIVTAFVVADGVSEHELQAFVANELSLHKRPRRVVFLPALPTNAMGKIQKSLLQY